MMENKHIATVLLSQHVARVGKNAGRFHSLYVAANKVCKGDTPRDARIAVERVMGDAPGSSPFPSVAIHDIESPLAESSAGESDYRNQHQHDNPNASMYQNQREGNQ